MVEAFFSLILLILTCVFIIAFAVVATYLIGTYGLKFIDYLERWSKSKD